MRAQPVNDRVYIILRGGCCHIIVLYVHAAKGNRPDKEMAFTKNSNVYLLNPNNTLL
jgi:hypothetical protein